MNRTLHPKRPAVPALLACAAIALTAAPTAAHPQPVGGSASPFRVEILVDGVPRTEYSTRGSSYIEALRGRDYSIRLSNPLPVRVAVALAVDGLNTIDAGTGSAWNGPKWVLGPYQTVEIPGWQVSGEQARRFVFTGERGSYGARLGETENLGVIEAVFFREKVARHEIVPGVSSPAAERRSLESSGAAKGQAPEALDDSYAATGMGDRQTHRVSRVRLRLERDPAAVVRLRYEFRPELERLGVLLPQRSPLERRERARGFSGFCPDLPR